MGTITLKDILRGIETLFPKTPAEMYASVEETTVLTVAWSRLFSQELKSLLKG